MSGSATKAHGNPLSNSAKRHVALSSPQSFMEDVTGAYSFGTEVPHFSSLVKISKFFSAPLKLEKVCVHAQIDLTHQLLTFGQIVCLDSLLWMLVIFPLRFLYALVILVSSLFQSKMCVSQLLMC